MKIVANQMAGHRQLLERKEAELGQALRNRDDIAIEKSADQMDEIQYASQRDLAMRFVDRDTALLRQVRAALLRIQSGDFGSCLNCEEDISPKRLAAVPWALRCIRCQEKADQNGEETTETSSEKLVHAA